MELFISVYKNLKIHGVSCLVGYITAELLNWAMMTIIYESAVRLDIRQLYLFLHCMWGGGGSGGKGGGRREKREKLRGGKK